MADGFDFFFSPTGPSWLPDRSPKGARRGRDGDADPRMSAPVFRNARPWRGPESDPPAEPEQTAEPRRAVESQADLDLPRSDSERSADAPVRLEPDADLQLESRLDDRRAPAVSEPARPAPLSTEQATGLLRDVAIPALRAAVSQLLARGHEVSLRDALDSADPRLVVLFLPSEGPLRRIDAPEPSLAAFEIRIDGRKAATPHGAGASISGRGAGPSDTGAQPSGPQVVARYSSGPGSGGFLTLGSAPAAGLARDWVSGRFVEFVQLTLERALDTT